MTLNGDKALHITSIQCKNNQPVNMFIGVTAPNKRCHGRTENNAEYFATR
jgi:hypothetical protein